MTRSVDFKLKVNWKPGPYHNQTVRKAISQTLWKKIRNQVLQDKDKTCSICGYFPKNEADIKKVHVHEVEEYSDLTSGDLICILKGLELICEKCHAFHHWGRTLVVSSKEQQNDLIKHFMVVNQCTLADFQEHLKQVGKEKHDELMKFINEPKKLKAIKDKVVKFKIDGEIPYKDDVINQLKRKGLYA